MWNYLRGWLACPVVLPGKAATPAASIVIAARNESAMIKACIEAIARQTVIKNSPIELIIVDDHSTDQTAASVQELARAYSLAGQLDIRLLHLKDYPQLQTTGAGFKKQALSYGIAEAKHEIILTTDADCRPQERWVATVLSLFEDKRVLAVAGPVLFAPCSTAFQLFQALDFCGTMGLTAAGIHQGWQHLANGANLSFRKQAWQQFGYKSNIHLASGDDMFFIQELAQASPGSIRFAKSSNAVVFTTPESTISAFVAQRLRWGTKSGAYKEWKTQMALGTAWCMAVSILLAGLAWLFTGQVTYGWLFCLLLLSKALADFPLLLATSTYFRQGYLLVWFVPSLILHTLYVALIGTASMVVKRYLWKGRKVQ